VSEPNEIVDLNGLKFNQLLIIGFVLIGFTFDLRIIPALVAAILIFGAITPRISMFRLAYRYLVLPANLMEPNIVADSPAQHRFAQLLGGLTLGAGAAFLYVDFPATGWSLAWVVILLAAVNILLGFCAGCFVYLHVSRLFSRGRLHGEGRMAGQ
jgi:hypothetical protein